MKPARTFIVDPWFVEQERRITEAGIESARLRRQMAAQFDPGHLYVVEFSSGVVKVGKAVKPEQRIATHGRYAHILGVGLTRTWTSEHHLGHSKTERALINTCKTIGRQISGEYFRDLSFDLASLVAECIVDENLLAQRQENDRARRAYLDDLIEAADGDLSTTWQAAHDRLPAEVAS